MLTTLRYAEYVRIYYVWFMYAYVTYNIDLLYPVGTRKGLTTDAGLLHILSDIEIEYSAADKYIIPSFMSAYVSCDYHTVFSIHQTLTFY